MAADGTSPYFELAELSVYIDQERRADEVRQRCWDREAASVRGLSSYIGEPPKARSVAELEAAARLRMEARVARAKSPIGKLYRAIADLDQLSYCQEAWTMRGVLDRAGSDLDAASVGAVVAVLAKIQHGLAREALEACAELLLQMRKAA